MPGQDKCAGHLGVGRDRLDPVKASAASARARKRRSEARKMGALGYAALKVEQESEMLIGSFLEAARRGDWRAAEALMLRVFGRPQERLEVAMPTSVEQVEQMSLAQIRHLRAVVEGDDSD